MRPAKGIVWFRAGHQMMSGRWAWGNDKANDTDHYTDYLRGIIGREHPLVKGQRTCLQKERLIERMIVVHDPKIGYA